MFTIKTCRTRDGETTTEGHEALSWRIVENDHQRAVVAHLAGGESAYLPVMEDPLPGDPLALSDVIYIENSTGKTTAIVRA